jgi:hypothetical protein
VAVSPAASSAGLPVAGSDRECGEEPVQVGAGRAVDRCTARRTPADNAPEAMLSLVTSTGVNSGLTAATSERLRTWNFPYVVPA